MMKTFSIEFCLADSEYMTALRLAVGAVCSAADVDVDKIDDMKLCVTESCLLLKERGYNSAKVVLCRGDGVSASVSGFGGEPKESDNGYSLALISAILSSVEIIRDNGVISGLNLKL